MLKIFRRRDRGAHAASEHRRPPPMTPIEIGLSLRSAREKVNLSLEDIRERTDVPMVDLDALEQGRLDIFHVEQAAVVGLWRYAEAVGLEPDPLVDVVHRSWPHSALSVSSFGAPRGIASTPLSQLGMAAALLGPILSPRQLSSSSPIGLSRATEQLLSAASRGAVRAVASIGPARPAVIEAPREAPREKALEKSNPKKAIDKPVKRAEPGGKKPKSSNGGTKKKAERPTLQVAKSITAEPEIEPTAEPTTAEQAPLSFPLPSTTAVELVQEDLASEEIAHQDDTSPTNEARVAGNWGARLSKVISQRFGVEGAPPRP